jgi:ankyrin repeat protein
MQSIPEVSSSVIDDESITLYSVGQLGTTNQIKAEGELKTLAEALQEAYVKSIKTDHILSICKENACLNDCEIEFLMAGGRLFKQIETSDVVDRLDVEYINTKVLGREPKIETASRLIRSNMVDEFKDLLVNLRGINEPNAQGNTLALVAIGNGNVSCLKLIFENGGDLNSARVSIFGSRHLSILIYLKSINKCNVNAKDEDGFTPLQQVTDISSGLYGEQDQRLVPDSDRIKCMQFLINEGAELNGVNNCGRSAFHDLAYQPSLKFLNALLAYSPDPTIFCQKGMTPIMYAYNTEIESRIREYCFK